MYQYVPSMLDVKYKELGGSGLVTTPLNMAPNLSECNVSHAGIALPRESSSAEIAAKETPLIYSMTFVTIFI